MRVTTRTIDSGRIDGKSRDVNTSNEVTRLVGGRIELRDWRTADLDRWAAWLTPGHRWKSLDGPYYALPAPDEVQAMVERRRVAIAEEAWPTPRGSLVIADKETDRLIGLVTWYWESEETDWPGVGIVIFDPAHWRGGRGYDALGLWSDYLFRSLPRIARLDLRTWSGNAGMMRLAAKLGYREEARFRRARVVEGAYYDGLGYGILREEWDWLHPNGFSPR